MWEAGKMRGMGSIGATIVRSGMLRTQAPSVSRPAPSLFYLPGLSSQPWWDSSSLEWVSKLESHCDEIRAEYENLQLSLKGRARSDYSVLEGERTLHKGDWDWQSFILKGRWQSEMTERCPRTTEILQGIPDLMTGIPMSYCFFSTLGAGAKIAPHFGPSNLRVRCHLTIKTPEENDTSVCAIRVGRETRCWKNGQALVFDDAYEHETWNLHPDQDRVVLLLDLWHPQVTHEERIAICDMFDSVRTQ